VDPLVRADLPAALASLSRGDAAPLVHALVRTDPLGGLQGDLDDAVSQSRFLATACLEARLPWAPTSAVSTRKAATKTYLRKLASRVFAPFKPAIVSGFGAAPDCAKWPATPAPEPPPAATPDVPVLVISGRDDIRTPLEGAQIVAAAYPHA